MVATTAPTTAAARRPRPGPFRAYLLGYGLATLGDQVWFVSLAWLAAEHTSGTGTGLILSAGTAPRAVLLLIGGAAADRYGPRRSAALSQAGRILTMLVASALLLRGGLPLSSLVAVALVFGALDALYLPAASAMPKFLLTNDDLPRGQAKVQLVQRSVTVAAGPAAGGVFAAEGMLGVCLLNVAAFGTASLLFHRSRASGVANPELGRAETGAAAGKPHHRGLLADAASGVRFVAGARHVRALVLTLSVLNLTLVGPVNLGFALLCQARGWAVAGLGVLFACFGAGSAAGAALTALAGRACRSGVRVGLGAAGVAGIALGLMSLPRSLAIAASLAAAQGAASAVAAALLVGDIQSSCPPAYVGRVSSILTLGSLGLAPLTLGPFGAASDLWGVSAVFAACGLTATAVCLMALLSSGRQTRRTHATMQGPPH